MGMENYTIKKSEITEHHYSEREKKKALEDYESFVALEVEKLYPLYDEFLKELERKNTKSDKYDFERLNGLAFDIAQIKRRVMHHARELEKNYNTVVNIPDFDATFDNHRNQ
jgi:IS1 family transposase